MQKLIFTDLDGTLLDHKTYSYKEASKALKLIKKNNIPLIFCTSKTRSEIENFREKLNNNYPFISENGGAIFIPKEYFDFSFKYNKENSNYFIIEFGTEKNKLKECLSEIKQTIKIKSFLDMSSNDISKDASLPLEKAKLAKRREYTIPFKLLEKDKEKDLKRIVRKHKLKLTKGGRYYHLMGDNNKGKAVKTLIKLYKKKYGKVISYAFGDSKNDFEMIRKVNHGFLVKKHDGSYATKKYNKTKGIGPKGFNEKVVEILQ